MLAANAFLRTIVAEPDDPAPRLVYADWLEERGDPHAELIRLQCTHWRQSIDDPIRQAHRLREIELITTHDADWLEPIRDLGLVARFRHGFLEVNVSGVRTFLEKAERLFRQPWVLHVHLRDSRADLDDIAELAASPHFERLQRLDLTRSYIRNDGIRKMANAPFPCRLTHLMLNHVELSTLGLKALLAGMDVSRLIELRLSHNGIGAAGAKAVSQTPLLRCLETLDLSYNQLGTEGGIYIAETLYLTHLHALFVRGNSIGTRGKKALRRRFGPRVHLGSADNNI